LTQRAHDDEDAPRRSDSRVYESKAVEDREENDRGDGGRADAQRGRPEQGVNLSRANGLASFAGLRQRRRRPLSGPDEATLTKPPPHVQARPPRNPTIRGKLRAADAILTAEAPSAITRGSGRRGDGPDLAVGGNATRQEESHINNPAFNAAATASSTASASSLSTKAKASAATSARRSARSRIASRWSTKSQASTRARGSTMLGRSRIGRRIEQPGGPRQGGGIGSGQRRLWFWNLLHLGGIDAVGAPAPSYGAGSARR
jgi:hypothetical protein